MARASVNRRGTLFHHENMSLHTFKLYSAVSAFVHFFATYFEIAKISSKSIRSCSVLFADKQQKF